MSMFSKIVTKVFGKKSDKDLKALLPIVNQINEQYALLENLNDDELKLKFNQIKLDLSSLKCLNPR